jgi:ketosteroid isomerase-like protein
MQVSTDTTFAAASNEQRRRNETVGEPSTEVKDLMTRFYEAASKGDFELVDGLISRRARVLWIGTDPNEWWENPEAVLKAWQAQTTELGGPAPITGGNVTAYQHGEVAWVSDRPAFHLPDGRSLPLRLTAVWVHEPEGWRMVQVHISLGVANESVLQPS